MKCKRVWVRKMCIKSYILSICLFSDKLWMNYDYIKMFDKLIFRCVFQNIVDKINSL